MKDSYSSHRRRGACRSPTTTPRRLHPDLNRSAWYVTATPCRRPGGSAVRVPRRAESTARTPRNSAGGPRPTRRGSRGGPARSGYDDPSLRRRGTQHPHHRDQGGAGQRPLPARTVPGRRRNMRRRGVVRSGRPRHPGVACRGTQATRSGWPPSSSRPRPSVRLRRLRCVPAWARATSVRRPWGDSPERYPIHGDPGGGAPGVTGANETVDSLRHGRGRDFTPDRQWTSPGSGKGPAPDGSGPRAWPGESRWAMSSAGRKYARRCLQVPTERQAGHGHHGLLRRGSVPGRGRRRRGHLRRQGAELGARVAPFT